MPLSLTNEAINHFNKLSHKDLSPFSENCIDKNFRHELMVNWHETVINLKIENIEFYKKCLGYFPKSWLNVKSKKTYFTIYIHSDNKVEDSFWEDTNSDCHFFPQTQQDNFICLQRDFIASKSKNTIHALCKNELSDGFFNLMRWLLPATWIKQNKFLIHSSAILNNKNEALLCLGPSGAGKSTISSFRGNQHILGDDMNLLTISDYKASITPSLLGQRFENEKLYGKSYPLKDIFWLVQAEKNKISFNNDAPTLIYLSQSLVNIFWKNLSNTEMMVIQNLIRFLNSKYKIKQLEFNLAGDIWDYVFKN